MFFDDKFFLIVLVAVGKWVNPKIYPLIQSLW